MARVLAALEADVLLLDEIDGTASRDAIASFFTLEPLSRLGPWDFVLGETGGRQRALVAARGRAIRPAETMARLPYPPGSLERLWNSFPAASPTFGLAPVALEEERGISAAAAWVDTGSGEALFVAVDLQAAGWSGSPQDRLRTLQAETIRSHVARELALNGGPAPVVIGGDLNLVGSRAPLFALVRGLDVDGSDLVPADARRLGERTYATWRNAPDLFPPGRLDFLLIPDAAVVTATAFVFTTEDLDDDALSRLDFTHDLSSQLSDHLIVVADLLPSGAR
jgi:endonuclease/exonuclease/phosphatase family metal-dependent hydrolase